MLTQPALSPASYLTTKRLTYYFRIRIPADLRHAYSTSEICVSLRTKHLGTAKSLARNLHAQITNEFHVLRWRHSENTFTKYLRNTQIVTGGSNAPTISEAAMIYLEMKQQSTNRAFTQSVDRAVRYLIEVTQDKQIDLLTRHDANKYRDHLLAKGLSVSSTKRVISVIRAILNFVCRERELPEINSFASILFVQEDSAKKRKPIPVDVLKLIQRECFQILDENRLIIALISDTGMRLSEALGLAVTDVVLDAEVPHLVIQNHQWRRLKTASSARLIPLTGASLIAARLALQSAQGVTLFSKYFNGTEIKSNSASAALGKWLKPRVPERCTVHSFRHSIRDRLREVLCPVDVADAIGGWARDGIGEGYGEGHSLKVKLEWLEKAVM